MSGRLLKKFLKEQEQAALQQQQLNTTDDDDEEEDADSPPRSSAPFRNPFDLLDDDGDVHQSSDKEDDDDDGAVINTDHDTPDTHSSVVKASVNAAPKPSIKSKKKKKKKKIKEDLLQTSDNDGGTSSLAIENVSLGASSSSNQQIAGVPLKPKLIKVDNHEAMMKKQRKSSVLHVDPKFLNAESEMRRIFGAKVVNSYEKTRAPANTRQMRGVRRVGHSLKRTILVSPSEHWPRWDGSLFMELLETKDSVNYFRYVHSSSYAHAQRAFEAAKAIHDFNGIASILMHHPYHIESLITLADYFKFTGEHQMSADATAKCLYALECAWPPQFTPSQNCQVKYVHDTNKPLFSSLFTHMKNMDRRGCHRSALEICKLLLSLDSDDPMGARLCIDYYSLRAEEYSWLDQFAEEYGSDNSLWLFPNFSFSLAISRFYLERNENLDDAENGVGKAASADLMKQALMLHPSVLRKLVDKVPLKERVWSTLLQHKFFKSDQTGSASLDHLISIYVERSYLMWRLPELQKFMSNSALSVIDMLEKNANEAEDWACVRKEAFSSEKNEYSHLLISDFSDSMPTMPPENLQDFIVDPRGGIENHGGFQHIPEEHHHEPRDVANRNALAVLFESMLPWVNYGTRDDDGDDIHHDVPDQADED